MAEYIDGAIHKLDSVIKHGKLKIKKKKIKNDTLNDIIDPEIRELVKGGDNIIKTERKEICKDASKVAENPVAKVKRKISKEVGRDLGLNMS